MTAETNTHAIYMESPPDVLVRFFNFRLANSSEGDLSTKVTESAPCHKAECPAGTVWGWLGRWGSAVYMAELQVSCAGGSVRSSKVGMWWQLHKVCCLRTDWWTWPGKGLESSSGVCKLFIIQSCAHSRGLLLVRIIHPLPWEDAIWTVR